MRVFKYFVLHSTLRVFIFAVKTRVLYNQQSI